MSGGNRLLTRTKKVEEYKKHCHEMKLRRNNRYPCPYNHTFCGERSCKECGVYREMSQEGSNG